MKPVADACEAHVAVEAPSSSPAADSLGDSWEAALEVCQLRWLDDALTPMTAFDEAVRLLRAKAAGLRRRFSAVLSRVTGKEPRPYGGLPLWHEREDGTFATKVPEKLTGGLKGGDLVVVRPLKEIRATLDGSWKHDGLKFLRPMEQYCERKFRVLKPVRRILDEHNHVMQKTRDTVILDGGICHGQGLYGREGCDRSCFFFWKEAWLRKVEE